MKLRLPTLLALAASTVMAFTSAANAQPPPDHARAAPPPAHRQAPPPPKAHQPAPPPPAAHRPAPPPPAAYRPQPKPHKHFRSWCDHPKGYYPEVRHCPSGWHKIPDHPIR